MICNSLYSEYYIKSSNLSNQPLLNCIIILSLRKKITWQLQWKDFIYSKMHPNCRDVKMWNNCLGIDEVLWSIVTTYVLQMGDFCEICFLETALSEKSCTQNNRDYGENRVMVDFSKPLQLCNQNTNKINNGSNLKY